MTPEMIQTRKQAELLRALLPMTQTPSAMKWIDNKHITGANGVQHVLVQTFKHCDCANNPTGDKMFFVLYLMQNHQLTLAMRKPPKAAQTPSLNIMLQFFTGGF